MVTELAKKMKIFATDLTLISERYHVHFAYTCTLYTYVCW